MNGRVVDMSYIYSEDERRIRESELFHSRVLAEERLRKQQETEEKERLAELFRKSQEQK